MINSGYINRFVEMPMAEIRLIYRAKSGDVNAFIELYDSYVEHVYRYIYFLVPSNRIAEGLTFQVFFKAWEQLDRYQIFGASFIVWLYSIVRNQVIAYYRTHKNTAEPETELTQAARGGIFREEFQAIREGLQFLTSDQQHFLILKFTVGMSNENIARVIVMPMDNVRVLQMHALHALTDHLLNTDSITVTKGFKRILEDCMTRIANGASTLEECLIRYPKHAAQLQPLLEIADLLVLGRNAKPLPTFSAYTHDALIQYARSHPRRPKVVLMPTMRRTAMAFAVLVFALLVTGTAQAQSALPGDAFYPWKRTSEQIWQAFSTNTVATDMILAERRLEEWIAVANDPALSASAMDDYQEVLARLESTDDALVVTALQLQQRSLKNAGLSSPELDDYLIEVSEHHPNNAHQQVPTDVWLTGTEVPSAPVPNVNSTDKCAPNCEDDKDNNAGGNDKPKDNNAGGNDKPKDNNAGGVGNPGDNNSGGNSDPDDKDNNGIGNQ